MYSYCRRARVRALGRSGGRSREGPAGRSSPALVRRREPRRPSGAAALGRGFRRSLRFRRTFHRQAGGVSNCNRSAAASRCVLRLPRNANAPGRAAYFLVCPRNSPGGGLRCTRCCAPLIGRARRRQLVLARSSLPASPAPGQGLDQAKGGGLLLASISPTSRISLPPSLPPPSLPLCALHR